MKFLHTADLHIGKIVNDFSMLEDQKFILEQIKEIAKTQKVDGVLLAGDIYDRAIPGGDAVLLLDSFLTDLSKEGIWVFLISGNHDSPERLNFGRELLSGQKIGIGSIYQERLSTYRLNKGEDIIEVVLLPYVKPAQVGMKTSGEAVDKILTSYWENCQITENVRRILITHYFVTADGREPELSDSETTVHVGGLDNVEASVFDKFDYVALGHIHKPQQIGDRPIYYAGAPLKYSFSEVNTQKSVFLVDIQGKEETKIQQIPLRPLHEMRKVKGCLTEVLERGALEGGERRDYIQAILTDKNGLIDPMETLRSVYPNVMQIVREDELKAETATFSNPVIGKRDGISLFKEFYELVKEEELPMQELEIIEDVFKSVSFEGNSI